MASNNEREGRRRRIMNRGSDRMALITGQIRSLDEFPSSPKPPDSTSTHDPPAGTEPAPSTTAKTSDVASASESQKHLENNEISKSKIEDESEPDHEKRVTSSKETIMAPVLVQGSAVTPSVRTSTSARPNFFSSKRINSCIIASERTRAICSLIIASLVLLSYVSYPLVGIDIVSSESIIASRPLYIVLLTDVTIVLARLFRERGNDSEEEEVKEKVPKEEGESWVGAVKLLERGLAAYQAIRGIFIDCSVYLVVVICGVSFI